ncbi:dihydroxyacetone kinase subunit DhaL [Mycoplasmopsis pullorum]|nr:dihydroxyacetone kinase subunit DhaL [Mycoplasmopsis pullorum]
MENSTVLTYLDKIATKLIANSEELTELDRLIGDGDHGINIKRGFANIQEQLGAWKDANVSTIFKNCAMILMSKVGGSSGPLLASAFLGMSKVDNLNQMLLAASEGIKARGKAVVGEKTMLDIIEPASIEYDRVFKESQNHKYAITAALAVAKIQLDKSKDLIATKGRASYLGERSKGTTDPGSLTMYLILETLAE